MNTPEHPREHPCSKWREHPLNTPPANTGRMKPKARKPNKIKGFACLNTLHTFSVNFTAWLEHIVHIDGVVGSSPTVTTTNPVGVQVQRLPDFFAYPSRVRTFRSQEYALFCQRGTQKGYAVHLKTAYPWKHFVHIHRDALANFRFFHQKHKQLTSSFSFEFRMPNRKKFQKIINTHLVAVL